MHPKSYQAGAYPVTSSHIATTSKTVGLTSNGSLYKERHVSIYTYIHTYIHTYTHTHIHIYTYTYIQLYNIYIYCIYLFKCMYISLYIHFDNEMQINCGCVTILWLLLQVSGLFPGVAIACATWRIVNVAWESLATLKLWWKWWFRQLKWDFNFDSQNMEDACDFTCINGGILGIYI